MQIANARARRDYGWRVACVSDICNFTNTCNKNDGKVECEAEHEIALMHQHICTKRILTKPLRLSLHFYTAHTVAN